LQVRQNNEQHATVSRIPNKLTSSSAPASTFPTLDLEPPHLLLFLLFFDSCTFLLVVAFGWQRGGGTKVSTRARSDGGPQLLSLRVSALRARQTHRRLVLFFRGLVLVLIRLLSGCGEDE
jgi:hypothetical protein